MELSLFSFNTVNFIHGSHLTTYNIHITTSVLNNKYQAYQFQRISNRHQIICFYIWTLLFLISWYHMNRNF